MMTVTLALLGFGLSTALQLPTTPTNPQKLRHAPPTAIFSDGGIDRTVTSADQDWSWTGMIEGEGDYEQDWGDAEAPEGSAPELTIVTSREATHQLSDEGGAGAIEEVEALLDSWQEALAIADDGSDAAAANPEALMASWRALIASREAALRGDRRADLRNATIDQVGWVPAYLTGWASVDNALPKKRRGGTAKKDDGDDVEAAAARVVEREKEFRREDDDFTFEWQKFAEKNRAAAARAPPAAKAKEPSALSALFAHRKREFAPKKTTKKAPPSKDDGAAADATKTARVGIDLGTTNCAVAVLVDGETSPRVLPTKYNTPILPSVVTFLDADRAAAAGAPPPLRAGGGRQPCGVLVGDAAVARQTTDSASTYASCKRLIGRTASADELQALAALDVPVRIGGAREVVLPCPALRTAISPVDVAAELISAMKQSASKALAPLGGRFAAADGDVRSAVVTVPAYFDASQRAATETACHLAGLDDVFLLREPEAAALAYGLGRGGDERVLIFDLGGGTFDVSIVDVGGGVTEVIATSGDPRLGGNDWDRAIANWLEQQFVAEHGVRISAFGRRRLLDAAEEAKVALSAETSVEVEVAGLVGTKGLSLTLSRRKMEAITRPLLLKLVAPMLEVASMARVDWPTEIGTLDKGRRLQGRTDSWRQQVAWRWQRMARKSRRKDSEGTQRFPSGSVAVQRVVLVGGATRMPAIGRFIRRLTGLKAKPTVNPEEAVALGAAVQAAILDEQIEHRVFNPYFHDARADEA